jgi:hypothetical protein
MRINKSPPCTLEGRARGKNLHGYANTLWLSHKKHHCGNSMFLAKTLIYYPLRENLYVVVSWMSDLVESVFVFVFSEIKKVKVVVPVFSVFF